MFTVSPWCLACELAVSFLQAQIEAGLSYDELVQEGILICINTVGLTQLYCEGYIPLVAVSNCYSCLLIYKWARVFFQCLFLLRLFLHAVYRVWIMCFLYYFALTKTKLFKDDFTSGKHILHQSPHHEMDILNTEVKLDN